MYRNLSYPTLLRLSHLHCHVKLTGVQTVQSKVPSKAKVKQSKLFVFPSLLSYSIITICISKLFHLCGITQFIAFRFTPLTQYGIAGVKIEGYAEFVPTGSVLLRNNRISTDRPNIRTVNGNESVRQVDVSKYSIPGV